jgi:tetratricopeptide (TPR) repeat protein
LYRRGFALLQENHLPEAIEQLDAALKMDPTLALAWNARGYAHYRQRQFPEAIADFDLAILLDPAYSNAYQNRSFARRATGDAVGADADAAKAKDWAPKK